MNRENVCGAINPIVHIQVIKERGKNKVEA